MKNIVKMILSMVNNEKFALDAAEQLALWLLDRAKNSESELDDKVAFALLDVIRRLRGKDGASTNE